MAKLAHFNLAKAKYPEGDVRMSGFTNNIFRINALAERSEGFVWRLTDASADTCGQDLFNDSAIIITLSVWEDVASLREFVYQSHHGEFVKNRLEWFEPATGPAYVLWWIDDDHKPDREEARDRLYLLRDQGETAQAFSFRKSFEPER